jgi:hypothetical protein
VSNPDKHKPLSAEELFKLLDTTSNKASDFDELDDFEKEALDGFSAHSDAQKAKALTDELNFAISKKVTSTSSVTKNKIIWFSAAASIVLILMVSIFFFNQTKEDSVTNIALNELNKDETAAAPLLEESKPLETINENATSVSSENKNTAQKQLKLQETIVSGNTGNESLAGAASAGEATVNTLDVVTKDEAKARSERDDRDQEKLSEGLADNLDAKKKEKNSLEQEQNNSDLQAKQNAVTLSSSELAENTKGTKEEDSNYKADADKPAVAQKSLKKEKSSSVASRSPATNASKADDSFNKTNNEPLGGNLASAPASTIDNKIVNAYYLGSELAIRDYVLNYLKEKQSTISLAGTYKIKGVVSVDGKLKVSSIIQLTKVNCNCEDTITEVLNTMIKWNPALEDGKKVSSNVQFTIAF